MGSPAVDAVVVGGGHNGLAAAAYLARAGKRVVVLERRDVLGGAVASARPWPGVDATLSRYSYLVSLLPEKVIRELGLSLELRERPSPPHPLAAECDRLAAAVFPTLTEPVPSRAALRRRLNDDDLWHAVFERPLGEWLEARIDDDVQRGHVLTDGLIGVHTHAHDPSLLQNRCFLLHVVGRSWDVPVGGMGRVAAELQRAAEDAGAHLRTGVEVTAIDADDTGAEVATSTGERIRCDHVLAGVAPRTLAALLGEPEPEAAKPRGAQLKVNLLLRELPPGYDFAGTVHIDSAYSQLAAAATSSDALPDPLPFDVYCHSLTDPSILGPSLRAAGAHTLTAFALHVGPGADGAEGARRVIAALDCADLLWEASDGQPCVEWHTQAELERELGLPGGNIFHRDPSWPCSEAGGGWGVETDRSAVLLCGAGAMRGGGVSAIPGHNAAMALLAGEQQPGHGT